MKINEQLITKLQSYGLNLSPAIYAPDDKSRDKKPESKRGSDGKWHWSKIGQWKSFLNLNV